MLSIYTGREKPERLQDRSIFCNKLASICTMADIRVLGRQKRHLVCRNYLCVLVQKDDGNSKDVALQDVKQFRE